MIDASEDPTLPRGWNWGETWREPSTTERRHIQGRWAVRNRDGRHVRVSISRWGFDRRIRTQSLELIVSLEDLARSNPVGFAEVMMEGLAKVEELFDELLADRLRESVALELAELNEMATRILGKNDSA
ncbi:MAG: hypothetical protein QOF49_2402 [Chloroflexota bacterium]|jgi:hypothetical protein|nr:hypothetical protein [Chloroflexota bacterium]